MIVADTDVLIDGLRGKDPGKSRLAVELSTGRLATTTITVFELTSGARSPSEREKVDTLLAALTILPLDIPAARTAAQVRSDLESRGLGLAMADYLIAGICLSRSAILMTRNRAHFDRVKGLAVSGRWLGDHSPA